MTKFTVNWMLLCSALVAFGGENETNFHVDAGMVELRATITDSLGRHVRNLTKDDFQSHSYRVRARSGYQPMRASSMSIRH